MPTDYVMYETVLDHPRNKLWDLLSQPELYPRFFQGVSSCTRIPASEPDRTTEYVVRMSPPRHRPYDIRLRTVINRAQEKLVLALVPESGRWVSLTLSDGRPGRTKITLVFSKMDLAHPTGGSHRKSEIHAWAKQGLRRVSEYLAGTPDTATTFRGTSPSHGFTVLKTLMASGVVGPARPYRGVRQLAMLSKWGFNMVGGYAQATVRSPNDIALIDDRCTRTFAELQERTDRLATGLADRGIGPDTVVAALARNHSSMVECMVASGKLGATLLLLNTGLATRQIEDIVQRHDVHTLFADDEFTSLIQYLPPELLRVSTTHAVAPPDQLTLESVIEESPRKTITPPPRPGKLVVLTSGTGGSPKGAKRPSAKGWGAIAAILSRIPFHVSERMLIAAPIFHSWGLAALQISTPLRGTVVLQDRFDAEECLHAISVHRCTALVAVPIMLQRILNLPEDVRAKYDTSSLRLVASSGSVMAGSLVTEFMDTFGDVLYNFYGSTEVSQATVAGPAELRAAPTTAGYPALGTSVSILDADGVPVPRGAVGRIFVGNDMLFDGYTDGQSAEVKDALMDTGDLGHLDADGRLFVSGRDDEMIISGGENVFPRPVEEALAALPQVGEVAVVGVPDDEYGQRLAAFIVPRSGARLDPSMVRSYIHHRLSRFSVPRDVTFLTRLPRNTTGKILKRLLVERCD
ncbi:MAG: AMP-binding protein [Actinophytocola sp.]|nr:AMP-binding protein [Actinophytocola sp.]